MKIFILFTSLLINLASCTNAQGKKQQHIAICQQGKGCEVIERKSTSPEEDKALGKTGFATNASDSATLVIENCNSRLEEKLSLVQIHQSYGGTGEPQRMSSFDIQKYFKEKGCLSNSDCANKTRKISFYINSASDGFSGKSYFFLNLKDGEAYMPNEAAQQLYGGELKGMVVDQFMRNNLLETYTIAEGKKFHTKMAIGTNMALIQDDAINEKRFKDDFRKTGKTRNHLNTSNIETEYIGKDDEGKAMSFWITPINDVCLSKDKFDAWGFYNLGYIAVDGITYMVTEISGSGFSVKVTGIEEADYAFNGAGYSPVNSGQY